MAGRPRTPTAILKLRGADKKDPQRYRDRANEPRPDKPLGTCPRWFGEWQKDVSRAWKFISDACPEGVLTEMDRPAMVQLAALYAEFLGNPRDFPAPKHARLHALLCSMGMTPVDRSKVAVAPKDTGPANRFARLANEA